MKLRVLMLSDTRDWCKF